MTDPAAAAPVAHAEPAAADSKSALMARRAIVRTTVSHHHVDGHRCTMFAGALVQAAPRPRAGRHSA